MRLGVLTGGGDCPGLNAVIRAVVRKGERSFGDEIVGFLDGWRGLVDDKSMPLDVEACRGLLPKGGTILGSSRTNPSAIDGGTEACQATLARHGIDALIAIGGEDTLGMAQRLHEVGSAVVGVPKTIDNDLSATEFTFGFHTAVQVATDAIDRLHTTAESHHRVLVCEVMGRHAGWIAAYAGIAGGAAAVLVPERPFDIDALSASLTARHNLGNFASVVVVAEGAAPVAGSLELVDGEPAGSGGKEPLDAFGHVRLGGIGATLAIEIEKRTGFETRATVLGHIQRGGTPTAFDRVLATRFGVAAVEAVHDGAFGTMVGLHAGDIARVPLTDAVDTLKLVDPSLLEIADLFSA